jgi:tRNA(fMet)-specific endonuclease VapC
MEEGSDIYAELKAAGTLLGFRDSLIAGHCRRHQIPLVTRNTSHFTRIPNLTVVAW